MLDQAEKAKFILALHKHSLQAFDAGGVAGPGTQGAVQNAVNPNSGFAGTVGGFLGLNNNFQANAANLQAGTNAGQLNQAYGQAQQGIGAQNQFASQAAQAQGFNNQQNVFNQQQQLANQLQQQANGGGPNPAQAALNQNTGQNIQNTAALMASQRGASANPALLARQAAQQGAATQQQAVGQGATLQAQQTLAAQNALQNQQQNLQNVAANQIAAQGQGANALSSAQQNEQNILQGANTSLNNQDVSMQGNINNTNAQVAAGNQNQANKTFGAVTQAVSSAVPFLGSLFGGGGGGGMAEGGEVKKGTPVQDANAMVPSFPSSMYLMADGGVTGPQLNAPGAGPQSFVGQFLSSGNGGGTAAPTIAAVQLPPLTDAPLLPPKSKSSSPLPPSVTNVGAPGSDLGGGTALGGPMAGSTDLLGSAGGAGALALLAAAKGGIIKKGLAAKGGKVAAQNPKQKAIKPDNSYSNDKVPSLLSEGEIVIPRSITMHPQAPQLAAQFVAQALAHRKMKGGLK